MENISSSSKCQEHDFVVITLQFLHNYIEYNMYALCSVEEVHYYLYVTELTSTYKFVRRCLFLISKVLINPENFFAQDVKLLLSVGW